MNMFSDAESALDRILALTKRCPDSLKEKCFEVLLTAYATQSLAGRVDRKPATPPPGAEGEPKSPGELPIPEEIRARFLSTAARLKADPSKMAALFDFNSDPFIYHALAVPGEKKADKTRNVALLLAAKGYLVNGAWIADWKEVKAMCVDQGCYDRGNIGTFLKTPLFKTASAADNVTLTSKGIAAAETLLSGLISPQGE